MTPESLRAALLALGLGVGEFAVLCGVDAATVRGWGKGRAGRGVQEFPALVPLILAAWTRHPELVPRPSPPPREPRQGREHQPRG